MLENTTALCTGRKQGEDNLLKTVREMQNPNLRTTPQSRVA